MRARELGIRVALGAGPSGIVKVIMCDAVIPLAILPAVGVAAALVLARLLASVLYGVARPTIRWHSALTR